MGMKCWDADVALGAGASVTLGRVLFPPALPFAAGEGGGAVSSSACMARSLGERAVHNQMPSKPPLSVALAGRPSAALLRLRLSLGRGERRLLAEADALGRPPACKGRPPAIRRPAPMRPSARRRRRAHASRRPLCSRSPGSGRHRRQAPVRSLSARTGQERLASHALGPPSLNPYAGKCTCFVLSREEGGEAFLQSHQLRHMVENFLNTSASRAAENLAPGASMLIVSPLSAMSTASRLPGTLAS